MEVSRKTYFISGSVLLAGLVGYLIYNRITKAALVKKIEAAIADQSTTFVVTQIPALDPNFLKTYGSIDSSGNLVVTSTGHVTMMGNTGLQAAATIYNAGNTILPFGIGNDDSTIVKQITVLGTKIKVSFVAGIFQKQYGKSMAQFIQDAVSGSNLNVINNTISNFSNT